MACRPRGVPATSRNGRRPASLPRLLDQEENARSLIGRKKPNIYLVGFMGSRKTPGDPDAAEGTDSLGLSEKFAYLRAASRV